MIPPRPFAVGDEITAERLNDRDDYARGSRPAISPGAGFTASSGRDGVHLADGRPAEHWFRVAAAASPAGWYTLVSQIETPNGGWTDGPWTRTASEVNLNANVPVGTTSANGGGPIVRGWRGVSRWCFLYGKCS